jgi:hypothetical protein
VSETSSAGTSIRNVLIFLAQTTTSFLIQFVILLASVQFMAWVEVWEQLAYLVIVFSVAVIVINLAALALGLPVRLVRRLRRWWVARPYVVLAILVLGVAMIALSIVTGRTVDFSPDGYTTDGTTFVVWNDALLYPGLLVIAFSICHYWPRFTQNTTAPLVESEPDSPKARGTLSRVRP